MESKSGFLRSYLPGGQKGFIGQPHGIMRLLENTTSVRSNPCALFFGSLSEPDIEEDVCWVLGWYRLAG